MQKSCFNMSKVSSFFISTPSMLILHIPPINPTKIVIILEAVSIHIVNIENKYATSKTNICNFIKPRISQKQYFSTAVYNLPWLLVILSKMIVFRLKRYLYNQRLDTLILQELKIQMNLLMEVQILWGKLKLIDIMKVF